MRIPRTMDELRVGILWMRQACIWGRGGQTGQSFLSRTVSLETLKWRLWRVEKKNGCLWLRDCSAIQARGSTIRSDMFRGNVPDFASCAICYLKAGFIIKQIWKGFKMLMKGIGFMPNVLNSTFVAFSFYSIGICEYLLGTVHLQTLSRGWSFCSKGQADDWSCLLFVGNFYLNNSYSWRFNNSCYCDVKFKFHMYV